MFTHFQTHLNNQNLDTVPHHPPPKTKHNVPFSDFPPHLIIRPLLDTLPPRNCNLISSHSICAPISGYQMGTKAGLVLLSVLADGYVRMYLMEYIMASSIPLPPLSHPLPPPYPPETPPSHITKPTPHRRPAHNPPTSLQHPPPHLSPSACRQPRHRRANQPQLQECVHLADARGAHLG